jgi:hydrogenase-1 operon protein HyaF
LNTTAFAPDDGPGAVEAFAVLQHLLRQLQGYRPSDAPSVCSLAGISVEGRRRLEETLGQGEVSLTVTGGREYRIHETSVTGAWRVRSVDDKEGAVDLLEVADAPSIVRAANAEGTCAELVVGAIPTGAMIVLPLLAEVRHRARSWRPGDSSHTVSLTSLPLNEEDRRTLDVHLGEGPVVGEVRGYGTSRVELTGHRNVWRVRVLNLAGGAILDTLEIGEIPQALAAAAEDFEDSAARLAAILGGP